jgi:hypothetical protein
MAKQKNGVDLQRYSAVEREIISAIQVNKGRELTVQEISLALAQAAIKLRRDELRRAMRTGRGAHHCLLRSWQKCAGLPNRAVRFLPRPRAGE